MSLPRSGADRSEAAGFVLAGGESSRMGTDKALVQLGGEPLIVRVLNLLRCAGLNAAIAGARSGLSAYASVIDDDPTLAMKTYRWGTRSGRGPLGGVCAALQSTRAEHAVFVSVDMPLLPSPLLSLLVDHARRTDAAVALVSASGFVQTFPAVVHRGVLPVLESELSSGNDSCFGAFRAAAEGVHRRLQVVAVENLVQAGEIEHPRGLPAAFWFLNVNTPDDLARAQSLLMHGIA